MIQLVFIYVQSTWSFLVGGKENIRGEWIDSKGMKSQRRSNALSVERMELGLIYTGDTAAVWSRFD